MRDCLTVFKFLFFYTGRRVGEIARTCAAARTAVRDIVVPAKQMFPPNGNRQTEIERPSRSYVVPPRSTNAVHVRATSAKSRFRVNDAPRKTVLIATDVDRLLGRGSTGSASVTVQDRSSGREKGSHRDSSSPIHDLYPVMI